MDRLSARDTYFVRDVREVSEGLRRARSTARKNELEPLNRAQQAFQRVLESALPEDVLDRLRKEGAMP